MRMIIVDEFWALSKGKQGSIRTIVDPKFVPRVGEQIQWNYQPTPTVITVNYDFEKEEICVLVK